MNDLYPFRFNTWVVQSPRCDPSGVYQKKFPRSREPRGFGVRRFGAPPFANTHALVRTSSRALRIVQMGRREKKKQRVGGCGSGGGGSGGGGGGGG